MNRPNVMESSYVPQTGNELARLHERIAPLRAQLSDHPVYHEIRTIEDLRTFQESHVFAVWDFMSLLKSLQQTFTCVTVPWVPTGLPVCRRFVNEIVLGEESDEAGGGYLSHFELYREAMHEAGANTRPIDRLVEELHGGAEVSRALVAAGAPEEARVFVESTFSAIGQQKPHIVAAAFTFGREDVIPDMFRSIVRDLNQRFAGQLGKFLYYLERHIDLDEGSHGPMALQMISEVCAGQPHRWEEAEEAAAQALEARLALWNAIRGRIQRARSHASTAA